MSEKNTKASTDETAKPEELADKDLDQASGGYYRYELTNLKSDDNRKTVVSGRKPSPGGGAVWADGDWDGN